MSTDVRPSTAGAAWGSVITPGELRFLLPQEATDYPKVFGGAGLSYAAFALVLLLVAYTRPDRQILATPPDLVADLVFFEAPGPAGGGGGGGNRSPEPPKTAPAPAVKPPEPDPIPVPTPEPVPPPPLIEAAQVLAVSMNDIPAAVSADTLLAPPSLGSGTGGGAGRGNGDGIGQGTGPGLGPGRDGGAGDGFYRSGSGIDNPTLRSEARPDYTTEGMLQRVQGEAWFDCVVEANGTVGRCELVKPLDGNRYGLDTKALQAARRFRFYPGRRKGEPVPVLVRIVIEFRIR